jgi:hypothetical protein
MSLNVAETRQAFPFGYDQVFEGLLAVLGPAGFNVKSRDQVIGRITASAGMSAFSWGEDVVIQVQRSSETSTTISVQSNLKVGFNLTATGKNAQNAERIIGALSHYLQTGGKDVQTSVAAAPSAGASPVLWVLAVIIGIIVLMAIINE